MVLLRSGLVILLLLGGVAYGQTKFEKEYRLPDESVPMEARQFVQFDGLDARIRWYFEENLEGNSIEAKFKHDKQNYSIEFDTLGKFLDIEVKASFSSLDEAIRKTIEGHLDSTFQRWKVQKAQLQYSGNVLSFKSFLDSGNPLQEFTLRFEIVVKGRRNSQWALYELTFNDRGDHLKTSRIMLRNTDNLEF